MARTCSTDTRPEKLTQWFPGRKRGTPASIWRLLLKHLQREEAYKTRGGISEGWKNKTFLGDSNSQEKLKLPMMYNNCGFSAAIIVKPEACIVLCATENRIIPIIQSSRFTRKTSVRLVLTPRLQDRDHDLIRPSTVWPQHSTCWYLYKMYVATYTFYNMLWLLVHLTLFVLPV